VTNPPVITEYYYLRRIFQLSALVAAALTLGCGTTTQRVATEQLLVSDAIDEAVAQIDFSHLAGTKVFLDTTYLKSDKKSGSVNTNYVISSLRQQLTTAGCQIFDSRNEVDIIVEPRVGAMGTDGHKVAYGIPKTGGLSAAAAALSGSPVAAIPEISFAQSDAQSGIAKLVVFAYDQQTRQPVWQSGTAKAESNSTSTWVLGAGPFQKGTVYDTTRFAGRELNNVGHGNVLRSGLIRKQPTVAEQKSTRRYDSAYVFPSIQREANAVASEDHQDSGVVQASFEQEVPNQK